MSRFSMLIVSTVLLIPGAALAQGRPLAPTGLWGSLAVGPSTPYDYGATLSLAYRSGHYIFRGRFSAVGELFGNQNGEYGLLVGRVVTPMRGSVQFSVGAGLGLVTGWQGGGVFASGEPTDDVMGVLLNGETRIRLTSFLGLSATLFGDLNGRESFGGLAAGIYLGQF